MKHRYTGVDIPGQEGRHSGDNTLGVSARPTFERHYSVEELAKIWQVSVDFVRRLFLREPGVVVFWRQQPGRRVYRTLRIPASVAERVHSRMTK